MPVTPAQRKQFICDRVNEKARAIAEGQGNWGENIVERMRISVPFELTAEEENLFKSTRPGARPIRFNAGRLSARVLVTLFVAGLSQARPQTQADPQSSNQPSPKLADADILDMHAAGLGAEVILAKIKASSCEFNTTPTDLKKLKSAGISDDVIVAMIGATAPVACVARAPALTLSSAAIDSAGKSTLHFYRERAFVGSARKMPIFMDEVQVADLVNGRQFTMTVDPGVHTFRGRTRPEAIDVTVEPGGEYYLRAELIQGFTKNHWRIVQMSSEQGALDVERLKPLDVQHIAPLARNP